MIELYELDNNVYVIVNTSGPVNVIQRLNSSDSHDVQYLWKGTTTMIKRPVSFEILNSLIPVMNTLFVIKDSGVLGFNRATIKQREFKMVLPRFIIKS